MDSQRADVVIIGGGPAGCTTGTLLKQYDPDRRIVIVEQTRFPRHHIGESMLPESNRILQKLGVLEKIDGAGFVKKRGLTYRWAHDKPYFTALFSEGVLGALAGTPGDIPDYAWQVPRHRYDQILLDHARECGVEVHEDTRVEDVLRESGRVTGVEISGASGRSRIHSQFVVDCSGQARFLGRKLGIESRGHALGDLAIYRYYRGFRWDAGLVGSIDDSKIFFGVTPLGWMWFIPLSEDFVSVGLVTRREALVGTDPDTLFDREIATLREMTGMLEGAVRAPTPEHRDPEPVTHTVADWSYNHEKPAGDGYYLAGDAAAFVDPILASGILLAHQSGLSVANAIHTEWSDTDITVEELHSGYAKFYSDLFGGFLRMADWWYHRRGIEGIDEWLRMSGELTKGARGAREIERNDTSAFTTFAAGFLTDYRFVNIGLGGYGDAGLPRVIDALGEIPMDRELRRELGDRSASFRRAFDRVDVAPYVVTDIDTNRWWRLPAITFASAGGDYTYRPPILAQHHSEEWVTLCLRVVERLLAACDGKASVETIVRTTRDRFPREHASEIQKFCEIVLADLAVAKVIERA